MLRFSSWKYPLLYFSINLSVFACNSGKVSLLPWAASIAWLRSRFLRWIILRPYSMSTFGGKTCLVISLTSKFFLMSSELKMTSQSFFLLFGIGYIETLSTFLSLRRQYSWASKFSSSSGLTIRDQRPSANGLFFFLTFGLPSLLAQSSPDYSPDDSSLEGVRDRFLRKALRVVCLPFLFSALLFFFVSLWFPNGIFKCNYRICGNCREISLRWN